MAKKQINLGRQEPWFIPESEYMGCTIAPFTSPVPMYFGFPIGEGCDDEGFSQYCVRVTFPDKTWVLCVNPWRAKEYIRANISRHEASEQIPKSHLELTLGACND
jgi:hypothetical protein